MGCTASAQVSRSNTPQQQHQTKHDENRNPSISAVKAETKVKEKPKVSEKRPKSPSKSRKSSTSSSSSDSSHGDKETTAEVDITTGTNVWDEKPADDVHVESAQEAQVVVVTSVEEVYEEGENHETNVVVVDESAAVDGCSEEPIHDKHDEALVENAGETDERDAVDAEHAQSQAEEITGEPDLADALNEEAAADVADALNEEAAAEDEATDPTNDGNNLIENEVNNEDKDNVEGTEDPDESEQVEHVEVEKEEGTAEQQPEAQQDEQQQNEEEAPASEEPTEAQLNETEATFGPESAEEASPEQPEEAAEETAQEAMEETPQETPEESPEEAPEETPDEAPGEEPPTEASEEAPAETSEE